MPPPLNDRSRERKDAVHDAGGKSDEGNPEHYGQKQLKAAKYIIFIHDNDDGPRVTTSSSADIIASSDNPNDYAQYGLRLSNKGDEQYTLRFHLVHGEGTSAASFDRMAIYNTAGTHIGNAVYDAGGSTPEISHYTFVVNPNLASHAHGNWTVRIYAAQNTGQHYDQVFYFGLDSSSGAESRAEVAYLPGEIAGNISGGEPEDVLSISGGGSGPEGDSGHNPGADYTIHRTGTDNSEEAVVTLTLIPGPGLTPEDVVFSDNVDVVWNADGTATLTVIIPPGEDHVDFSSLFVGDTNYEGNEDFQLILTGEGEVNINESSVETIIIDDDASKVNVTLVPDTSSPITILCWAVFMKEARPTSN